MKTLNVRFLAILLVSAFVLVVGIVGVHYFQVRRHASFFLDKAVEANAKEDLRERGEAVTYFRRYLALLPKETDARADLGMLLADLGMFEASFRTLEQVLREDATRADARRRLIDMAMAARMFGHARDHLKVLLAADPNNAELLELVGQCQVSTGELDAAERTFAAAIKADPTRLESYTALARLLRQRMSPGQTFEKKDAERNPDTWINKMVEANPKTTKAYLLRGEYWRRAGKAAEAEKDVAKALELAPGDEDALLLAADCALDKKDYDQARRHAQRVVELFPKSPKAYRTLSLIEIRAERMPEARAWIDKGLLATDDNPELLFQKANLLLDVRDIQSAETVIEKIERLGIHPALLAYLQSRVDYAQEAWAKAARGFEQNRPTLLQLGTWNHLVRHSDMLTAECYDRLGRPDLKKLALQRAGEFGAVPRQSAATNRMVAPPLPLSGSEGDAVIARLRSALESGKASPADWIEFARQLIFKSYQLTLKNGESKDPAKVDWREAEYALEMAAKANPGDFQVSLLKAQALLIQKHRPESDKLLRQTVDEHCQRWNQWTTLIQTVEKEKDPKQAAAALDEAAKTWAANDAALNQAKQALQGGDAKKAVDVLTDAREKKCRCWDIYSLWVRLAEMEKDWNMIEKLLTEAQQRLGDMAAIRLARAQFLVRRDGEKAIPELKKIAEAPAHFSADHQQRVWLGLSSLARQAGDPALGLSLCQKVAQAQPNNLQIRQVLFDVAREANDAAAMQKVLDEVRKIEDEGPYWHYMQAILLVTNAPEGDRTPLEQALKHLAQASLLRPNWAQVSMLVGKIRDQLGDQEAAIDSYTEAVVSQGSRDPVGMSRLQQLLMSRGRTDEAMRILQLLEQQHAEIPYQALLGRAQESLDKGNVEQGMADLDRVLADLKKTAASSKKYSDHQRVAEILMAKAQIARENKHPDEAKQGFDEAEKVLRHAIELAPQETSLRLRLVQLLHHEGNLRGADEAIADARKSLPSDKAPLTLAQCYGMLDRRIEAEQQYDIALEKTPNAEGVARLAAEYFLGGKQAAKGEKILRDMVEGKRPASESDMTFARRALAFVLLKRGDHQGRLEAITLCDQNLKANPKSVKDLRMKARILAFKASIEDRKQARALLESLINVPNPSPEDQFELAKVLMADKDWSAASRQMQPLLASNQVQPEWLEFYIRSQIRRNESIGAEGYLKRLEQLMPGHILVAYLRAQIFSGRGLHDRAIGAMTDFLANPKSQPADQTAKLNMAAQTLEDLASRLSGPGREEASAKYLKQAEEYYRENAKLQPSQEMALVGFLGRQGRCEDALKMAEDSSVRGNPIVIATTVVSLLTTGEATPPQIQRVEKILNAAIEKHGKIIPLLLALAELRVIQQRYDEAESIYADVLKQDNKNVVALNNLAVFLALRKAKLDEALRLITDAIQAKGPMATLVDSRATVYLARGQWKEALEDLEAAIEDQPSGTRYFHLAQALLQANRKEEAVAALKKADDFGLKVDQLQPLERPAYRQLREDLK